MNANRPGREPKKTKASAMKRLEARSGVGDRPLLIEPWLTAWRKDWSATGSTGRWA